MSFVLCLCVQIDPGQVAESAGEGKEGEANKYGWKWHDFSVDEFKVEDSAVFKKYQLKAPAEWYSGRRLIDRALELESLESKAIYEMRMDSVVFIYLGNYLPYERYRNLMLKLSGGDDQQLHVHTHAHTHTHYIYIYTCTCTRTYTFYVSSVLLCCR